PHGRGDADQQLPVVADILRRAVGDRTLLARLRRAHAPASPQRLRPSRTPLWWTEVSAEPAAPTAVKPTSEYRTRLWMGAVMALAVAGILVVDHQLEGWLQLSAYPCLLVTVLLLCVLSILELHALLGTAPRPPLWLCLVGGCAVILGSWPALSFILGE